MISAPLAAKLCVGPQKFPRCKNVLEVLYHCAKFGEARISPATGAAKTSSFCLFVCLFVRHACERQSLCARFRQEGVGMQKRFWYYLIGEGL